MENRNGLLIDLRVEPATGYGERVGALAMLDEHVPDSDTRSANDSGSA